MDLIPENVSALAEKLGTQPDIITKFLTDATASADIKPFADSLGTLHVFQPDTFTQRLANERQQAAQEATSNTLGKTYGAVDERVKKATGIDKQQGESTLDYQERAFREKYSKTTDSEEMQRLRDDAKAARELLTAKTQEFDNYKQTKEKEADKARVASAFATAVGKLPLADPSQAEFVQFKFEQKYSSKPTADGVEYTDRATGQVVRDPDTAGPMGLDKLLAQFAPTIQGVSFKQPSAKQPSGYKAGANLQSGEADTMDFSGFTSAADFTAELRRQGIAAGGERAGKLYEAFKKARPELFT